MQKSIELVTKIAYASGTIQQGGYLIRAATRAGVKDEATVLELAHIFRWNIDFFHEVRSGDNFKLLYEEEYLKNAYHGDGNILIAEYTNRQGANLAIRYEHSDGSARYYDLEGNALRRAFLRAPLEFVRISSPFNPRRFHPIHKQIMPHRGIDYAAPIGTPVHATGDGIVQEAGYTRANGYYVVINQQDGVPSKIPNEVSTSQKNWSRYNAKYASDAGSESWDRRYVRICNWTTSPLRISRRRYP